MKFPTRILTGAALMVAALSPSFAQTATTAPVGYRTETLLPGFNLLGVDLAEKVEAAGVIDAVAGNVITDNDVDFTALGSADLLIKLTDGPNAGTLLQANQTGAHTLTVVNGGSSAAVGGKYELRKSATIASIFGAANSAGLKAGGDLSVADNVYIPTSSGFIIAYYSDGTGFDAVGWTDSSGSPAGDIEIPYSLAFFVKNSTASNKDVVFVGHVVDTATKFNAVQNFNYVSRVLPVAMTLDASNLKDNLQAGGDLSAADNVYLPQGASGYRICYYSDGSGFDPVGWVDGTGTPAGTANLTSGFLVLRRSASPTTLNLIIPNGLDI